MKELKSWLLLFLSILFLIFRIIVSIYTQSEQTFGGFFAFDLKIEIIILFITILSLFLVAKRNIIGGILYTITYCYYFGGYFVLNVANVWLIGNQVDNIIMQNGIIALIGVFLSIITLLDIMFEKIRKKRHTDKKTDWFFENKNSDRKLDDKSDKNQYKLY